MKGKRWLARGLVLLLVLPMLTVSAWAVSFSDMVGHWAREDVEYLAGNGVVNGTSDTTFAPDRAMTACEAVIFCSRATGVSDADKAIDQCRQKDACQSHPCEAGQYRDSVSE